MASLRSPLDLSDRLGLRPTEPQLEVLERFTLADPVMDVAEQPGVGIFRAVALCALWRLLLIPGSRVVVIAANKRRGGEFMSFLHGITTKIDPALSAVCRWPRWSLLKIGQDAGYEARYVSNRPAFLQGMAEGPTTFVVLGAGDTDPDFVATRQVVESYAKAEQVRIVRVW